MQIKIEIPKEENNKVGAHLFVSRKNDYDVGKQEEGEILNGVYQIGYREAAHSLVSIKKEDGYLLVEIDDNKVIGT